MPNVSDAPSDEHIGDVAGILAPLQVPEGQGAVQQGEYGPVVGQAFDGIGQAFHLPHGAQRAEQGTRDQGLAAGAVRRAEVQVIVLHGQGGLAEQPAAEVLPIGDGAAAQVDEVAAQGQVAVHVDVGAVHGNGRPVLGNSGGGRLPSRPSGPVRAEM